MEAVKEFFANFRANVENIPVLGAVLLALTNESVVVTLATAALADYITNGEYVQFIAGGIGVAGLVIVGTRQWADMKRYVAANVGVLEEIITDVVDNKYAISVGGKTVLLDIPDELEPQVVNLILSAVAGVNREAVG